MKHRIIVGLITLLLAFTGLIGIGVKPASALGSCSVAPACYAEDIWYLANGSGVDGGQVKMKVCSMSTLNTTTTFWVDLTDGERVQGGINLLSNGGFEFYSASVDSAGVSHTLHGADSGKFATASHYYYVKITQEGGVGASAWDVTFYDGSTLAVLWDTIQFMDSSANGRALRTGNSTTNGFGTAWSSESELQFYRTDHTWASNWNTATNPGSYTGFYYGDTTANGAAAWHVGYAWLKTSLNHVLGCL